MYEEIIYIIALKMCRGVGDVFIKKMIEEFGSAKQVWEANMNDILKIRGIGNKISRDIGNNQIIEKAIEQYNISEDNNIDIISYKDYRYPDNLKEIPDFPVLLSFKGNINFNLPSISIVGTRNMSSYGRDFIDLLFDYIKEYDIQIISGLALGVDGYSHKKAVENNISTIGVMGHGLKYFYPPSHKDLSERMMERGGMISEFLYSEKIEKAYFIQRNRIIAGLSPITIVVESAYGGGAISTAKFAFDYNREVLALPGRISDKYSQGCNKLIMSNQAQILANPKQILDILGFENKRDNKKAKLNILKELSQDQILIVDSLKKNGRMQIDSISLSLNKPSFFLMSSLLDLELKDVIKSLPGKYYELIKG